ncbi:MAG: TatD family hydrolase [Dehalococcoidia bacterium]|nr:TatD family hydrolase [Dehalococcoidia bacterium]
MFKSTSPIVVPNLIDSHAHLTVEQYESDRSEVIQRAHDHKMNAIINMGTTLADSHAGLELSQQHDFIYTTVGIHPQECFHTTENDLAEIAKLAQHSRVVGIGEIGLDYHANYVPHQQQIDVFQQQLSIASGINKPIVIHSRQAETDTMQILLEWTAGIQKPKHLGVIHCFSGTLETAQAYLEMGFYISLGAYIGYPSSRTLRKTIKHLPLGRIILETDCPFLPPQSKRGQRNEPSYVTEVALELARIYEKSPNQIGAISTANCRELFQISD